MFEWQAVAVARLLAGRAELPSRKEMEKWEQDRIAKRGDGVSFSTYAPEFEEYFEEFRTLAGKPASGSTGRVLPKYDPKWLDAFLEVVTLRNQWWDKERRQAEKANLGAVKLWGSPLTH